MQIKTKKLHDDAVLPQRGSLSAAGSDLTAYIGEEWKIAPNETRLVPTGLAIAVPEGFAGLVYARSGLASKRGLAPANKVGVIDADYRGELFVALHNHSAQTQTIQPGERIAQLVITPFLAAEFVETDTLEETERGAGGFGSTGK